MSFFLYLDVCVCVFDVFVLKLNGVNVGMHVPYLSE